MAEMRLLEDALRARDEQLRNTIKNVEKMGRANGQKGQKGDRRLGGASCVEQVAAGEVLATRTDACGGTHASKFDDVVVRAEVEVEADVEAGSEPKQKQRHRRPATAPRLPRQKKPLEIDRASPKYRPRTAAASAAAAAAVASAGRHRPQRIEELLRAAFEEIEGELTSAKAKCGPGSQSTACGFDQLPLQPGAHVLKWLRPRHHRTATGATTRTAKKRGAPAFEHAALLPPRLLMPETLVFTETGRKVLYWTDPQTHRVRCSLDVAPPPHWKRAFRSACGGDGAAAESSGRSRSESGGVSGGVPGGKGQREGVAAVGGAEQHEHCVLDVVAVHKVPSLSRQGRGYSTILGQRPSESADSGDMPSPAKLPTGGECSTVRSDTNVVMRHQMSEWARYPDRKGCVLQRFVRSRSRRPAVYRIVWRDEPHANSGRTRNFGFCIASNADAASLLGDAGANNTLPLELVQRLRFSFASACARKGGAMNVTRAKSCPTSTDAPVVGMDDMDVCAQSVESSESDSNESTGSERSSSDSETDKAVDAALHGLTPPQQTVLQSVASRVHLASLDSQLREHRKGHEGRGTISRENNADADEPISSECTVYMVHGQAIQGACDALAGLRVYLEHAMAVRFGMVAADFVHGADGRWWFLQLKAFELRPRSLARAVRVALRRMDDGEEDAEYEVRCARLQAHAEAAGGHGKEEGLGSVDDTTEGNGGEGTTDDGRNVCGAGSCKQRCDLCGRTFLIIAAGRSAAKASAAAAMKALSAAPVYHRRLELPRRTVMQLNGSFRDQLRRRGIHVLEEGSTDANVRRSARGPSRAASNGLGSGSIDDGQMTMHMMTRDMVSRMLDSLYTHSKATLGMYTSASRVMTDAARQKRWESTEIPQVFADDNDMDPDRSGLAPAQISGMDLPECYRNVVALLQRMACGDESRLGGSRSLLACQQCYDLSRALEEWEQAQRVMADVLSGRCSVEQAIAVRETTRRRLRGRIEATVDRSTTREQSRQLNKGTKAAVSEGEHTVKPFACPSTRPCTALPSFDVARRPEAGRRVECMDEHPFAVAQHAFRADSESTMRTTRQDNTENRSSIHLASPCTGHKRPAADMPHTVRSPPGSASPPGGALCVDGATEAVAAANAAAAPSLSVAELRLLSRSRRHRLFIFVHDVERGPHATKQNAAATKIAALMRGRSRRRLIGFVQNACRRGSVNTPATKIEAAFRGRRARRQWSGTPTSKSPSRLGRTIESLDTDVEQISSILIEFEYSIGMHRFLVPTSVPLNDGTDVGASVVTLLIQQIRMHTLFGSAHALQNFCRNNEVIFTMFATAVSRQGNEPRDGKGELPTRTRTRIGHARFSLCDFALALKNGDDDRTMFTAAVVPDPNLWGANIATPTLRRWLARRFSMLPPIDNESESGSCNGNMMLRVSIAFTYDENFVPPNDLRSPFYNLAFDRVDGTQHSWKLSPKSLEHTGSISTFGVRGATVECGNVGESDDEDLSMSAVYIPPAGYFGYVKLRSEWIRTSEQNASKTKRPLSPSEHSETDDGADNRSSDDDSDDASRWAASISFPVSGATRSGQTFKPRTLPSDATSMHASRHAVSNASSSAIARPETDIKTHCEEMDEDVSSQIASTVDPHRSCGSDRHNKDTDTLQLQQQKLSDVSATEETLHISDVSAVSSNPSSTLTPPSSIAEEHQLELQQLRNRHQRIVRSKDGDNSWEQMTDPASGRPYYRHRATYETVWEKPQKNHNNGTVSAPSIHASVERVASAHYTHRKQPKQPSSPRWQRGGSALGARAIYAQSGYADASSYGADSRFMQRGRAAQHARRAARRAAKQVAKQVSEGEYRPERDCNGRLTAVELRQSSLNVSQRRQQSARVAKARDRVGRKMQRIPKGTSSRVSARGRKRLGRNNKKAAAESSKDTNRHQIRDLLKAVTRGSVLQVQQLLSQCSEMSAGGGPYVDVNSPVAKLHERTALHIAAECGHLDVVHYLVKNGAKPSLSLTDADGLTPSMLALTRGHQQIACVLLAAEKQQAAAATAAATVAGAVSAAVGATVQDMHSDEGNDAEHTS